MPNEPNSCDDVCTTQHQYVIEVATNSGGVSGVDGCQANPISLVTKPIPAGGAEGDGAGGVGEVAQEERAGAGDRGRDEGVGGEGDGSSTLVDRERPPTVAVGGNSATSGEKMPRRTNPILVMTCAQHNITMLLKLRRILVVFRELTVVKRTQFFW